MDTTLLMNARGMTLIEILTATVVLSVVVILAIGQVDVTRVRLSEEVRRSGTGQAEAALALAHIVRSIQEADRVQLLSSISIQLRRFMGDPAAPGALDNGANYLWVQYRFDAALGAILFFDDTAAGCVESTRFSVSSLDMKFIDPSPAPPGGEPFASGDDNNVLDVKVDGRYSGRGTMRSGAYTKVLTGLAPAGVSDPPPSC